MDGKAVNWQQLLKNACNLLEAMPVRVSFDANSQHFAAGQSCQRPDVPAQSPSGQFNPVQWRVDAHATLLYREKSLPDNKKLFHATPNDQEAGDMLFINGRLDAVFSAL
jgi:hypothetical protein